MLYVYVKSVIRYLSYFPYEKEIQKHTNLEINWISLELELQHYNLLNYYYFIVNLLYQLTL